MQKQNELLLGAQDAPLADGGTGAWPVSGHLGDQLDAGHGKSRS